MSWPEAFFGAVCVAALAAVLWRCAAIAPSRSDPWYPKMEPFKWKSSTTTTTDTRDGE